MKYYYMFVLSLGLIVYLSHEPHIEIQSVQAETPQIEETVKEQVVAEVKHEPIAGPNYTIRVGLPEPDKNNKTSRKPIYTLTGLTVDERAKEWLAKSSPLVAGTLPIWKKYGEQYGIDYTVPICIAWADSHLGAALKSKNNVGNIGNNDRGDTKSFDSLDKGIMIIFWHMKHGTYVGGHEKIGTMSNEGRTRLGLPDCNATQVNQKCYATSQYVWSTNVINCLSALHDTQIDESYLFRK